MWSCVGPTRPGLEAAGGLARALWLTHLLLSSTPVSPLEPTALSVKGQDRSGRHGPFLPARIVRDSLGSGISDAGSWRWGPRRLQGGLGRCPWAPGPLQSQRRGSADYQQQLCS